MSPELGYVQEQMIRFSFYMESEEENPGLCVGPICVGGGVNTSNMHIHKFYFRQLFIKGRQSLPIKFRHW